MVQCIGYQEWLNEGDPQRLIAIARANYGRCAFIRLFGGIRKKNKCDMPFRLAGTYFFDPVFSVLSDESRKVILASKAVAFGTMSVDELREICQKATRSANRGLPGWRVILDNMFDDWMSLEVDTWEPERAVLLLGSRFIYNRCSEIASRCKDLYQIWSSTVAKEYTCTDSYQCAILREMFAPPEFSISSSCLRAIPRFLRDFANNLAQTKDWGKVPVLSLRLQEAGFKNEMILDHFTNPTYSHREGCWALQTIVGAC